MFFTQVFFKKRTRGRDFIRDAFYVLGAGVAILALPSFVFYYNEEDWTYIDCFYYVITSLSTVGFGDLVNSLHGYEYRNGYLLRVKHDNWVWAYRVFTLCWLLSGLSFFSLMISFLVNIVRKCLNALGECPSNDTMKDAEMWHRESAPAILIRSTQGRRMSAPAILISSTQGHS